METRKYLLTGFVSIVIFLLLVKRGHCIIRRRRRRRTCHAVNCVVSGWSNWSTCSQLCGSSGRQSRSRYKTQTETCGLGCGYTFSETRACNIRCCAVNCVSSWQAWGACTGCGNNGQKTRNLQITRNPSCGGSTCPSTQTQTQACVASRCCPVNCATGSWGVWSSCNAQCENTGIQLRSRAIIQQPSCNGASCPALIHSKSCNGSCCRRDCLTGIWGVWSSCNAQCENTGVQMRSREITLQPSCNGTSCPALINSKSCNGPCCRRDCITGIWGVWSSCNAQCENTGVQLRSRAITLQPSCNGTSCPALIHSKPCNGSCCRRDCTLRQWTPWGVCSAPAGPGSCAANAGLKPRTRSVVEAQSCGGVCQSLQESRICTRATIHCQLNAWSAWNSCSPTTGNCGAGMKSRSRIVKLQPQCSTACPSTSQTTNCVHSCCPVNCVMSAWGTWNSCSSTCGTGLQTRRRLTVVTQPSCSGNPCPTNINETKACSLYVNVNCQLSQWITWSECSASCGSGVQIRNRTVIVQLSCNGKNCESLIDIKQCQNNPDKQHCKEKTPRRKKKDQSMITIIAVSTASATSVILLIIGILWAVKKCLRRKRIVDAERRQGQNPGQSMQWDNNIYCTVIN